MSGSSVSRRIKIAALVSATVGMSVLTIACSSPSTDGPCGEILRVTRRSPMRPEHVHFWLHAEGYEPLITTIFRDGDPYLNNDAVFGAKRSLDAEFVQHEPGAAPDGTHVDEPFQTLQWTLTFVPKTTER
jgi:hydroxyquinol 1,2-dioxygenase